MFPGPLGLGTSLRPTGPGSDIEPPEAVPLQTEGGTAIQTEAGTAIESEGA